MVARGARRGACGRRFTVVGIAAALAFTLVAGIDSASAVDYSLPSLWQAYKDDFVMGTFGNWNSQQALYHYRANSPPNQLKLDSQVGTSSNNSLSRQAYVAAVNAINADPTLSPEQKAAAIEQANEHIVLQPTTGANQAEGILQAIEAYNRTNNLPEDQKKIVRGHVFAWHGGQQPNWFFCDGFLYDSTNPDWASPQTMLGRLDNYIHAMVDKYAKYSDIIVSWDVVNEAIDDYTGQVRNGDDAQVSQWGRIFRRPDLDGDPDARLYAESAWIRQAFESARRWSNAAGVHWKLYYNDFQDSNKLYEPKMSQTIKMLRPIHEAGDIDGYGMQGRLAWAYPSIAQLRTQINAGLTVADEISISESDIRSDFEPNPDYNPALPTRRVTAADGNDPAHQWPAYGSCSWNLRTQANGNTFDVCNSPVRRIPAWGVASNDALANSPEIMRKQADFAAGWMDLLLSYKGKIKIYDFDGTSDAATFNSTTGGHLWSGLPSNPEKYSFFAVIGAAAREKLREAIARIDLADEPLYTAASWQNYLTARHAAENLVDVRIYDINGVNNVKTATDNLNTAIAGLERVKPDLVVTSISTASKVYDGQTALITATLTNQGPGAAGASTTAFALDGQRALGSVQTPDLPAGRSVQVSLAWNTSGLKGQHTIAVTADSAGVLDELVSTNNTGVLAVTVKGNKVQNGSFESAGSGGGPEGWTGSSTEAGQTSWSQSGEEGSSGATITGTGGSVAFAGAPSWSSAPIPVVPGELLDLVASVKSTAASSAPSVQAVYLGPAGGVLNTVQVLTAPLSTGGFVSLERTLTIPAGVAQVRLVLTGFGATDTRTSGTVTFDNVGLFSA